MITTNTSRKYPKSKGKFMNNSMSLSLIYEEEEGHSYIEEGFWGNNPAPVIVYNTFRL